MLVLSPEEVAPDARGMALTIGAYDGVHLGHRRLLAHLGARAEELGLTSAVVTFDRHPASVVRPESAPRLLTDFDQKMALLEGCGVDLTAVVRFDEARAKEEAEDFVDTVLVRALGARLVVVGQDFHFGRERRGNVALLASLGAVAGFEVEGVALAEADGEGASHAVVSSTRVRRLIADGDVAHAAALLTRPHELRGEVVHGDGRGGPELGIPTANVALPDGMAVPRLGIYAGFVRRADGSTHPAAISVGLRPTFAPAPGAEGGSAPLVEAHLLDFDGDLYGERLGVAFVDRLRDEQRFSSVEALVDQMHADLARTREIVGA